MSVKAMARVWELELHHSERLVLLALADHADHLGANIYPSVGLIAWKSGYSESQVRRIMRQLVAAGFLKVMRNGGGRGNPTVYRFDLEAGTVKAPHVNGDGGSGGSMTPIPIQPAAMTPIIGNGSTMTPFPSRKAARMTPFPDNPSMVTPIPAENPATMTPFRENPATMTPFTDNPATLTPIEPLKRVSFDELKGVISDRKGVIAMTPEPFNHLTTTTTTRAWHDDQDGGGGGETMKYDVENVENDPLETQANEADVENVKRDLVDALSALGIRPEMASKTVTAGTVKTDYDVILCKRFIQASTANVPAAVLWSQYLSVGRLPPAPHSETSTVTSDQLAVARRMREESERRAVPPGEVVGLGGLAAALSGPVLRSIAPSITLRPPLPFPGRDRL